MSVLIGTPLDDTLAGDVSDTNTIFGDAVDALPAGNTGGNDVLNGGANSSNTIFGDVGQNLIAATGGDDQIAGGSASVNVLVGDAPGLNVAKGGDDVIIGGDLRPDFPNELFGNNEMFGDAFELNASTGGDDRLVGGFAATNFMVGDARGGFNSGSRGGNDVLIGGEQSNNFMAGDTGNILDPLSIAGNDSLTGGEFSTNRMMGDVHGDLEGARGGDDTIVGAAHSTNELFGDAFRTLALHATGGDDILVGGSFSSNELVGDGPLLKSSTGGDDELIAGPDAANTLFGDGRTLTLGSTGGDDTLVGGERGSSTMFGDAFVLDVVSAGGDDTLFGAQEGDSTLVGDAAFLSEASIGGDDLLVSGPVKDEMWGDAQQLGAGSAGGHDVFRFLADSGDDTIHDFERGKDIIEVSAGLLPPATVGTGARLAAFAALAQAASGPLTIEERDADGDGTTDSIMHLDVENSVTVLGVTGLTSEDIVAAPGSSYVLFGRTSAPIGTRDKWLGSEGNSQASNTPGGGFRGSAFNADTATAAGTVLAGAGFADYVADGILTNANVAMFDLTESPLGVFATGAAGDLETKIAASTPLFGGATTDLDAAHSNVDAAAGDLHLAQTDADWNAIKNIEVSLDSTTSLRDIRLENFVDTRIKIGDVAPDPDAPQGAVFDVQLLGAKRGEVDASHAPQAIDLLLEVWTNDGTFQNSFDIKGSIFDDTVTLGFGQVAGSQFGEIEGFHFAPFGPGTEGTYGGHVTTVFTNLGAGSDQFDSETEITIQNLSSVFLATPDTVWGGTGDDLIVTGNGADRLFGDNGSGARFSADPFAVEGIAGNDHLTAGGGADWIEGNGDTGVVRLVQDNLIVNGSFEEFDRTPDAETISHDGGKWFTFRELTIDNVPGWSRDGDVEFIFGGPIELQTNAVGGLPAFDGLIKLELDSHPDFGQNSFTFLQQQISPLPGAHYHVSFAYAPRSGAPAGSSAFDFSFYTGLDGDPANIAASFANDQPGWHLFEADIVGSITESAVLTFSPGFPTDTLGALIDDVRVTQELTLDLSLAGDVIDCGTQNLGKPDFESAPDTDRDTVNFNAGDGFDVVQNFGAGVFVRDTGFSFENVDDVLRIENVGVLTTEVVFSDQGHGTLVQSGAGSVFLVGVTTPLTHVASGNYLLVFDAT